ncbi:hypothetical protein CCS77_0919 [Campylobacter concisus]|uniref:Uncharacterized protein n=1 Tax=Campylobacter concisus TaxID=199 RepID=A0A2R4NZW6_9BACT|nr:hypothetical protein CCS77_0919 [Campylobacter concisus]
MTQALNLLQKKNSLTNCVIGNDGLAMRIQKLANMRNLS